MGSRLNRRGLVGLSPQSILAPNETRPLHALICPPPARKSATLSAVAPAHAPRRNYASVFAPALRPCPPACQGGTALTAERVDARWKALRQPDSVRAEIADAISLGRLDAFARNIENFIGTVKVPVGIAGPLRVNGAFAHGDFHIPLATTEAALIASYDRGARVITEVGGCSAALLNEGVIRAPGYAFRAAARRQGRSI